MPHPLLISSQSDYLIQVFDRNSYIFKWQTVQIQISWLLKKPTDLDLHCLLRQGMSCSAREGLKVRRQWHEFLELIKDNIKSFCKPYPAVNVWTTRCIWCSFFFFFLGHFYHTPWQIKNYYSRTSMAQTSLGPWKFVRDMGGLSHWGLIMVPSQEANNKNLGFFFQFSTQLLYASSRRF